MGQTVSRRRAVIGAGALVVSSALAGCTGGGDGAGDERTIEMTDDLKFDPANPKVRVGGTVIWENIGSVKHTVTAYQDRIPDDAAYFASGGFDTEEAARDAYPDKGDIPEGESYEHTFEVKGTYEYFCIPHEDAGMTGTIEIAEEGPQL